MTTTEYLAAIHLALVESSVVVSYTVVRQRITSQSEHIRVCINLVDGDFLEAAEFFRLTPEGIEVADYRHQWMDGQRTFLRKRWDSAPHYPQLPNAPHHYHDGSEEVVNPGQPMSIQDVLAFIAREIQSSDPHQ
ncbi:MAG: hypothetical protein BroJett011_24830 [Chloroflexota bacterium]|nr:MAG: hypothetical protein BroJett011_24830 [Chloroflexota bacterium]